MKQEYMILKCKLLVVFTIIANMYLNAQPAPPPIYSSIPVSYIRTYDATTPELNPNNLITGSLRNVKQTTQYLDGLGRQLQIVVKKGSLETDPLNPYSSAGATDLVSASVYDGLGREQLKYLPFAATNNDGLFKSNPFQQQVAFYNVQLAGQTGETNVGPNNDLNWAFRKNNFEASPLNRVDEIFAPGVSWVGSEGAINSSDRHPIKTNYWVNTTTDAVQIWNVTDNAGTLGSYSSMGPYATGELYKNVMIDQHSRQIIEFKDKEGKLILKKIQLSTTAGIADDGTGRGYSGWLCTYYIYDRFNNLRCVIQPRGVELISSNWLLTDPTILNEQCFRYEFDERGRMIMKKLPGAGRIDMVYDARNRLIMVQDGNLRLQTKWLLTKYDLLNRPVMTGLYGSGSDRQYFAQYATNSIDVPFNSFDENDPVYFEKLTETFYDDYNWLNNYNSGLLNGLNNGNDGTGNNNFLSPSNTAWPYPQAMVQSNDLKGLVTGIRVKVLGTQNTYLYTINFYDPKGRLIQTQNKNITGGTDMVSTQYTWAGQPLVIVTKHEKVLYGLPKHVVITKMLYDDLERLLSGSKIINSTLPGNVSINKPQVTLLENRYDKLGQLVTKKVGQQKDVNGNYINMPIETLSYNFNIRGWLLGINKNYLNNSGSSSFFGMELNYDKDGYSATNKQYNGNIGTILWRSQGDGEKRKYDFNYDAANRLLKADFNQLFGTQWAKTDPNNSNFQIDFSVSMGDGINATSAYDANGNILAMQQNGLKINTSPLIDNLAYTYYTNTNKLKNVIDLQNDAQTKLADFRSSQLYMDALGGAKTNSATDYTYDDNGNLKKDRNKDIGDGPNEGFIYNYLNLPQTITIRKENSNIKGIVSYVYDATGNKLQKITTEYAVVQNNNVTDVTTTTDYIGSFVYESKTYSNAALASLQYLFKLQFRGQEEGRIRGLYNDLNDANKLTGFAYDYFIKDHQGNVRMVLTDEQKMDKYPVASMEDSKLSTEQQYYTIQPANILLATSTTIPNLPSYNSNDNGIGNNPPDYAFEIGNSQKMYKLIAGTSPNSGATGLGITLKVMAGDKIDIWGRSYYYQNNTGGSSANSSVPILDILNGLLGTPSGAVAASGHAEVTGPQLNSLPGTTAGISNVFLPLQNNASAQYPLKPKAFINYIFFDEQFRYAGGGFSMVGDNSVVKHQAHHAELQDILVPKNGYVYIYCSNESPVPVYFDNLQVVHTRGAILEETHYYPFGLAMSGISSKALNFGEPENKRNKFQSQEFTDAFGINYYEFNYRNHDPQIGRFIEIDPVADYYQYNSAYAFSENRVISSIEIEGLESHDLYDELGPVRDRRKLELEFGINYPESKGEKFIRYLVGGGLGIVAGGAIVGIAIEGAPVLFSAGSSVFWWACANPETAAGVAYTIVVAASGYEGPDLPGPGDDFGRMGRKVYDRLIGVGIKNEVALETAARNSYNAIIGTIDKEMESLGSMEMKAKKAFEIRNKAKEFAREVSGPSGKVKAEAKNIVDYGRAEGPTFDQLFKKYYDEALKSGLKGDQATNKAYELLIDAAKRTNPEINKQYGIR